MIRAVIFDGDDTLWRTEALYDSARACARKVVEAAGLDGARWEERERRRDVENAGRLGYSIVRFPQSCVEIYEELCEEAGVQSEPPIARAIASAAERAFSEIAPLLPFARQTLEELRSRGLRLILLTKGETGLQLRRIEESGLAPMFDVIEIVDAKTSATFAAVLAKAGVTAGEAVSVGNSVLSDVLPSLDAGVQPIWIDAHVWEYERTDGAVDEQVIKVDDLAGLLGVMS